jgi:hypothetical protein
MVIKIMTRPRTQSTERRRMAHRYRKGEKCARRSRVTETHGP